MVLIALRLVVLFWEQLKRVMFIAITLKHKKYPQHWENDGSVSPINVDAEGIKLPLRRGRK